MNTSEAARLYKVLRSLANELDRDAPLMQALALARIAMSGEVGLSQTQLMDDLKASVGGTSRTVQALSSIHYNKDREGYGLVERVFDPQDNRKRELYLTPKGKKAVDRIVEAMSSK